MGQIYRFEEVKPPVLNESMLKNKKIEKDRKRNIRLVCLASLFSMMSLVLAIPLLVPERVMLALIFEPKSFLPALFLAAYVGISLVSVCVVSVVYSYNRRVLV